MALSWSNGTRHWKDNRILLNSSLLQDPVPLVPEFSPSSLLMKSAQPLSDIPNSTCLCPPQRGWHCQSCATSSCGAEGRNSEHQDQLSIKNRAVFIASMILHKPPGDNSNVVRAVIYGTGLNPGPFIASQEIALISNSNHRHRLWRDGWYLPAGFFPQLLPWRAWQPGPVQHGRRVNPM